MLSNCKGCLSLLYSKRECCFTLVGVEAIPNCPCQECLVKTMCRTICEEFVKVHNFNYPKAASGLLSIKAIDATIPTLINPKC
jgi:hypothetical protein